MAQTTARTRRLTVVAQDLAVCTEQGRILCGPAEIPAEALDPGQWGHRVQVIDFDATTNKLLAPLDAGAYLDRAGNLIDPFKPRDRTILTDPQLHAHNVYATASLSKPKGARFAHGAALIFPLVIGLLLVSASVNGQVCPSPDSLPSGFDDSAAAYFSRGMGYLDANCIAEARTLVEKASLMINNGLPARYVELRTLIPDALILLRAREAIAAGRPADAEPELRKLLTSLKSHITVRAAKLLAEMLKDRPDDSAWTELDLDLDQMAARGDGHSDLLRNDRRAAIFGAASVAREVEARLAAGDLGVQRALTLQTLLADLYLRDGRILAAQLLLVSLESDVGMKLFDLRVRERFLETGVALWSRRVDEGRTEFQSELDAYRQALTELQRVVG